MNPRALYIHIPFCRTRCDYCAFHSTTEWTRHGVRRMVEHIGRLLDRSGTCDSIDTAYIGGGTPSLLPPKGEGSLAALLGAVRRIGPSIREITVEANPDSIERAFLATMEEAGVARLSVGIQSLDREVLRALGRRSPSTLSELEAIRAAWPGSLSVDLIHAAPLSNARTELASLQAAIDAGADHLSIYDLSVEPETPLSARVEAGALPDSGEWWGKLTEKLEDTGFVRYEVSNFARPGHESLHNTHYWRGDEYFGTGPGAVSTVIERGVARRITQTTDHAEFLAQNSLLGGAIEDLTAKDVATERIMLGLRTRVGISMSELGLIREAFGALSETALQAKLNSLARSGHLRRAGERIAPTNLGMDLLDVVLRDLFAAL